MFHDRRLHNKINRLHERALRIVYKDDLSTFEALLKIDNSVSIHHRNIQSMAIELYKSKEFLAVDIMNEIFIERKYKGPNLRSQTDFHILNVHTVYKGEDSLKHFGPLIWEIVPDKIKKSSSLKKFKEEIKQWVPENCPCRLCKDYVQGLGYVISCMNEFMFIE